jgi:aldehyde dehydrogenase (NAD+)
MMNQPAPYQSIIDQQNAYFQHGKTKSYSARIDALRALEKAVREHENDVLQALHADLRKHPQEAYMTEIGPLYGEINYLRKHLKRWMQARPASSPIALLPGSSTIYPEPLGMVLIITPWNYPFLLSLRAAAGAIAAGNTVILKPSEMSPNTSAILEKIIRSALSPELFAVVTGEGHTVIPNLLQYHHFDHIHFTGSTAVGSKIMEMAAKHLSPVTLELGGKSPAIIAADAPISVTAKRIVWGKFLNCGQTCVAPDYLLVHRSIWDKTIQALKEAIVHAFGDNPQTSESYPRIIHDRRFATLASYLNQGNILHGGQTDATDRYIAPTLLSDVSLDAPIMREEIFGPILPIIPFDTEEEALTIIARNPYPLALYVFSRNSKTQRRFIDEVRFGGGCINETILQLGNEQLPFGGVGYSGHGQYHGEHSFNTFSHFKSVVRKATWFEPSFRHPPFTKGKLNIIRRILG